VSPGFETMAQDNESEAQNGLNRQHDRIKCIGDFMVIAYAA